MSSQGVCLQTAMSKLRQDRNAKQVARGFQREQRPSLQPVAERLCPEVASVQQRLAHLRPAGQLMTGSGSTVFALCRDSAEALRVARQLGPFREERAGWRVCVVRSCY